MWLLVWEYESKLKFNLNRWFGPLWSETAKIGYLLIKTCIYMQRILKKIQTENPIWIVDFII